MLQHFILWPTLFAAVVEVTCRQEQIEPADLIVLNGRLQTIPSVSAHATALAVRNSRFICIDTNVRVRTYVGPDTKVIDAAGRTVIPGFNDAHIHPQELYSVESRLGRVPCDPEHVKTLENLIAALKKKAAITPKGKWILGEGYQDTKLGGHPTKITLDLASIEHPIYLEHSSFHVAAVNSMALKLANINQLTPDPPGGSFDRDGQGEPNGILRESAKSLVRNAGPADPKPTREERLAGLKRQFEAYVSHGITSIQIAGTSTASLDHYLEVQAIGPPVRVYAMLRLSELKRAKELRGQPEFQTTYMKVGAIKHFHGNSLSGRTCWLYEPYANRPDYYGIPPKADQHELNEVVWRIHRAGLQACIHSNGDREIDMVLTAFEAALKKRPLADHRHRIEHASVVSPAILNRIKKLGVVLALHSYVYEHGDKMEAYGPVRWEWMHANRTAIDMGIPVAGNSDSPVSAARPLLRIQSMMTRASAEGKVYGSSQRVSWKQALKTWTTGSAFASFDERNKGQLKLGQLADFVILGQSLNDTHTDKIKDVPVEMTVIGGKVVYNHASRPNF